MAIALKNWTSGTVSTPLSIDVTSLSIAAGDYVVVAICNGTATTGPLSTSLNLTGDVSGAVYGREGSAPLYANSTVDTNLIAYSGFATGADTTLTMASVSMGPAVKAYIVYVFTGVDTTTPEDVATTTATGTGTDLADPPSNTSATNSAWMVAIYGGCQSVDTTWSQSGLANFNQKVSTTANYGRVAIGTKLLGAAPSTYDPPILSVGQNAATLSWAAYTIILRPAGAAAPSAAQVSVNWW